MFSFPFLNNEDKNENSFFITMIKMQILFAHSNSYLKNQRQQIYRRVQFA